VPPSQTLEEQVDSVPIGKAEISGGVASPGGTALPGGGAPASTSPARPPHALARRETETARKGRTRAKGHCHMPGAVSTAYATPAIEFSASFRVRSACHAVPDHRFCDGRFRVVSAASSPPSSLRISAMSSSRDSRNSAIACRSCGVMTSEPRPPPPPPGGAPPAGATRGAIQGLSTQPIVSVKVCQLAGASANDLARPRASGIGATCSFSRSSGACAEVHDRRHLRSSPSRVGLGRPAPCSGQPAPRLPGCRRDGPVVGGPRGAHDDRRRRAHARRGRAHPSLRRRESEARHQRRGLAMPGAGGHSMMATIGRPLVRR
jgi:hypothetical protein